MNTTSLCNSNSGPGSPFSPQRRSPEYSSATSSANSGSGEQEVRLASNNPKKRAGRKKFTETRHPVYRGVRRKSSGRWVCELREPTKQMRIWLGTFPTLEMAARAYDAAAIALRGKNACVNFADSFTRLRIPDSTDPKIIQRAAAEAAEAFRPSATEIHALPVSSGEDHNSGISNVSNYEQTEESAANNVDSANNNGTEECGTSSVNYSNLSNMNMNNMMEEYGSFGSGQQENRYYMDDESIFDMPGLLADMASGMMLPPPGYAVTDEIQFDDNIDLWSY